MDLLAAWLLYPLALGAVCLGLGLLAERLAAWRMPGALLVPVGLAALLALARLIADSPHTTSLALPVIVVLALAGLVAGRARLRELRPDPWIAIAVLGVFAVFAAPVVLSGSPTFAGYLALPDTSHQLSLAHLLASHGTDYTALPMGSERVSLLGYIATSYPIAAQAALGVTGPLGMLDIAWLYQPFLTFMALASCLGLAALVGPLMRSGWQTAVTVFVAGQSALVVGYALEGSIKEMATLAMFIAAAALVAAAIRERRPARSLLTLGIVGAAALGSLGPASLPYLAVVGLVALAVWGRRAARERVWGELAWLAGCLALGALLAAPVLDTLRTAITINTTSLSSNLGTVGGGDAGAALGNLAAPLDTRQALGIWLSGDFRYHPSKFQSIQDGLSILALAAALLGLLWSLRRRAWGPLLLAAIVGPTSIYLLHRGNAYADGKVLMIASAVGLTIAMLGAASLWTGRWRPMSLLVTAALALGVLYSNALAYRDVSLAPYDRYEELLSLNSRLAGKGPVVLNEYDEFGKYFLRDVPGWTQPEWPHAYRIDPVSRQPTLFAPLHRPSLKTPLDLDDLTLKYLQSVPYLIVRRSPVSSRPPSDFRVVWSGRFYDLWRRDARPEVLRHEALGPDILHPATRVSRVTARAWARRAERLHGRIAFVVRRRAPIVLPSRLKHQWSDYSLYPGGLVTSIPSNVTGPVGIPRTDRYHVWMEGSFGRRLDVRVDGARVAQTAPGLENAGAYQSLVTLRLSRGVHTIEVLQGIGDRLAPGNGGYRSSLRHIGAIVFDPAANERHGVTQIEPRDWRRLAGVEADWLEILRR